MPRSLSTSAICTSEKKWAIIPRALTSTDLVYLSMSMMASNSARKLDRPTDLRSSTACTSRTDQQHQELHFPMSVVQEQTTEIDVHRPNLNPTRTDTLMLKMMP
ncbi:hypothetical protein BX616_009173 [Lobosporangium transversale]|nr:hypothetical protein BX616_009173 [Lobosporangium transversale]